MVAQLFLSFADLGYKKSPLFERAFEDTLNYGFCGQLAHACFGTFCFILFTI